jgi:hypothetical protein
MNTEEIKQLLEKYYNGKSSIDEELILKDFFSREIVPDELEIEKDIFIYYSESSAMPLPSEGFGARIINAIDDQVKNHTGFRRRRIYRTVTGIAAGILILTGSYFFFTYRSEPADTFSDPEIAYNEAMKILYAVSAQLNNGTRELGKIGMMQDAANESIIALKRPAVIVEEKLKTLEKLHNAYMLLNNDQNKTK